MSHGDLRSADNFRGLLDARWLTRLAIIATMTYTFDLDGFRLLHVGFGPSAPRRGSTMRQRILGNHLKGNGSPSTHSMSLGCLLSKELGNSLQQVPGSFHLPGG